MPMSESLSWFPTLRAMWSPKRSTGDDSHACSAHQALRYRRGGLSHRGNGGPLEAAQAPPRDRRAVPKRCWPNILLGPFMWPGITRAAAGRLVVLYLPTYSPWLNPIEMLLPPVSPRGDAQRALHTVKSLLAAARDFFDRYNREPCRMLSVIGSHAQNVV
jgi:transposase